MTKNIDARGLSCPYPAMMAKKALQEAKAGELEVLVDSGTSRDNVVRMAQGMGWMATIEEASDGSFRLVLKK